MSQDLFADRLATLRAERAKAEETFRVVHARLREVRREHTESKAVVERLTFAIAQLEAVVTPPEPKRIERLDITEAVFTFLAEQGPHTIAELAAAIERKRNQIAAACTRLSVAGRIELLPGPGDRYGVRQAEEQRAAE